jgi:GT2 family glycosyltransferase
VAAARGRQVVLLNNDTLVLPGWLEALLAPFGRDGVGLVGAKLINWDGTLQEAGGIYWRDGSAWNFGRGGDVRAPAFNYLKDVDYCSGAAIALPRGVWDALGGFDEHYLPAYCEDADLAFRVRAMGLRCVYQPRAEVVHHEGRSHGRDVAAGVKAYQVANQAKLRERWAGALAGHYDNAQNVLRARDRSFERPHILVIDHYVPKVDQDAGSRSVFSMIGALVESGWAVTFWPDNLHEDPDYTPLLQAMGWR